jgi:hypothetical protein
MTSKFFSRPTFAKFLIVTNGSYWIIFALLFAVRSYPYEPHRPVFEEVTPTHIFFGRALPEIDTGTGLGLPSPLIR